MRSSLLLFLLLLILVLPASAYTNPPGPTIHNYTLYNGSTVNFPSASQECVELFGVGSTVLYGGQLAGVQFNIGGSSIQNAVVYNPYNQTSMPASANGTQWYFYPYCNFANSTTAPNNPPYYGRIDDLRSLTAPIASISPSFTASPGFNITQNSVVNFTDTSTVSNLESITGWNWSFGDGSSASTQSVTKYFPVLGAYNISLKVVSPSNSTGATAYHTLNVIPYNMASNVTLNYDVRASDTGALLAGASIGIQNTTDNIWRNSTSPTGLSYFKSTEPGNLYPLSVGQTVGLYAGMTGYQSSTENVTIPYDGYHAYQYLIPNGVVNATGAGTVVVNVVGNSNGIPISGASLTFDTGQLAITNTAGSATVYNVTAGNRTIQTSAPNYQSAVTGAIITAGATNGVLIQLVGVGQTPVATYAPGVTTPVPTDTYGNPISGNTSSSALNTTSSAGILTMLAELIQLWPLGVLLVLLKAIKAI